MNKLFLLMFSLMVSNAYAQFDYRIFQSYADPAIKKQNSKLISASEFQLSDKGVWTKTSYQEFNVDGLPLELIQYDENGKEAEKKDFNYNNGQIAAIKTYKYNKQEQSAEFTVNDEDEIISFIDYVYDSLHGKKQSIWKTYLEYNTDRSLKKMVKTNTDGHDTTEINFYNSKGELMKSVWNNPGLRTKKINYVWNSDSSVMKEEHFENDSSIYSTVIHKYKNKKEVEKVDPSITQKPFYWKYDNNGRVIETNEAYYYITYCTYDANGMMSTRTIDILFSDSNENDLPKKIKYKYEYQNRVR